MNMFVADKVCFFSFILLAVLLFVSPTRAQSASESLQQKVRDDQVLKAFEDQIRRDLDGLALRGNILKRQLESLEAQQQDIETRKRSHVQCLVNLIACYKKRK